MLPRKGARVADLSVKDIMNVLEVRATLDGLASGLSAERITADEIKELKHYHSQFISHVEKDNLQGSIKKDVEFHDIIYRSSRNDKLIQISNNLREQVQRFRVIYIKDYSSTKELVREHAEIIDAIINRDSVAARESAQRHIKNQEEAIIRSIRRNQP